jgi:hypothetical protein
MTRMPVQTVSGKRPPERRRSGEPARVHAAHPGITLTEILITIAVLTLVIALLGYPIFSAFGYIQKALAKTEAQRTVRQGIGQLAKDLGEASYIYPLPPDGSWVTLLPEMAEKSAQSYGMPMDFGGKTRLIRYAQLLNFPWVWVGSEWQLLRPNYQVSSTYAEFYVPQPDYEPPTIFADYYMPFHQDGADQSALNPYQVVRYETGEFTLDQVWGSAAVETALNGSFPLNNSTVIQDSWLTAHRHRNVLMRRLRNEFISITPYGDDYDVPHFQVTPLRQVAEAMRPVRDRYGRTLAFLARYPLWAGRALDFDLQRRQNPADPASPLVYVWEDAGHAATYQMPLADIQTYLERMAPLYPRRQNPYGYQLRVFDEAGNYVYGLKNEANTAATFVMDRHVLDWPVVGRPELVTDPIYGGATALMAEILRHRAEGKVVCAQPMALGSTLTLTDFDPDEAPDDTDEVAFFQATLPIPPVWRTDRIFRNAQGFDEDISEGITYLVTPPRVIALKSGATSIIFRQVERPPARMEHGQFRVLTPGSFTADSRQVLFAVKKSLSLAAGDWDVQEPRALYTISDVQATDSLVATYSTQAVLDLVLTVSRRDRAGRTPQETRQDATVKLRVEARNAIKRARRE